MQTITLNNKLSSRVQRKPFVSHFCIENAGWWIFINPTRDEIGQIIPPNLPPWFQIRLMLSYRGRITPSNAVKQTDFLVTIKHCRFSIKDLDSCPCRNFCYTRHRGKYIERLLQQNICIHQPKLTAISFCISDVTRADTELQPFINFLSFSQTNVIIRICWNI